MHLADEILEHFAGDGEIGDDAVLHGAYGLDRTRRTPEHAFGLDAHRQHTAVVARSEVLAYRHHRRFVQDDALAAYIDEGIGCAEIDGKIAREVTAQALEHSGKGTFIWE